MPASRRVVDGALHLQADQGLDHPHMIKVQQLTGFDRYGIILRCECARAHPYGLTCIFNAAQKNKSQPEKRLYENWIEECQSEPINQRNDAE